MTSPPETLHHYTTAAGLLGIVEPSSLGSGWEDDPSLEGFSERRSYSLWATDARYLNDSAELMFAAVELADMIEKHLGDAEDSRRDELRMVARKIRQGDFTSEDYNGTIAHTAYVTCFCRNGDLLSQWRGYGANGGGYSIEFSTDALKRLWVPAMRAGDIAFGYQSGSFLYEVKYGASEASIEDAASRIIDGNSGWELLNALVELAQFKHPAFEEEDEWRIINSAGRFYVPCRFRPTTNGGIVPYMVLIGLQPHSEREFIQSAIKSITVGPGPDQDLRAEAVRQLLQQREFYDVDVRRSEMTYRG